MRDADERQLDRVLTLVGDVLGTDAVGAYLFGSAVLGGLQPRSDLDLFVVSKRETTREEKQRLVDRLPAKVRLPVRAAVARRVRERQPRAVADQDGPRSRLADHDGAAREQTRARPAARRGSRPYP